MTAIVPPTPPDFPLPTDDPVDFDDKAYPTLDYIPLAAENVYQNTLLAEAGASSAENSATAAAASEIAAELAETNAEAAAAAAQAAAGLTPDPDFGMVIATTASTVVKTSAYTAEVGVLQDVDTSGGAFAITLLLNPLAPKSLFAWLGWLD